MKTLERLAYAKARIVKLDAKMVVHNTKIKNMAAKGGPGTQAEFDAAMKARRSTIATRKRWLKVIAEYEVKNAVC